MPMTPSGTRTRAMSRPLGRVHARQLGADRIGQGGDVVEALGHRFDALLVEQQAVAHAPATTAFRRRDVAGDWRRGSVFAWSRIACAASLQRLGLLSRRRHGASVAAACARGRAATSALRSRLRCSARCMRPSALMSPPDRRDGSSRRGHGSRGWPRFHRFYARRCARASAAA